MPTRLKYMRFCNKSTPYCAIGLKKLKIHPISSFWTSWISAFLTTKASRRCGRRPMFRCSTLSERGIGNIRPRRTALQQNPFWTSTTHILDTRSGVVPSLRGWIWSPVRDGRHYTQHAFWTFWTSVSLILDSL